MEEEIILLLENNEEEMLEIEDEVLSGGTNNYNFLINKPKINDVELINNKTLEDLKIQEKLQAGENIEIVDNVISVKTAPNVEKDNTKPITSGAVYTEVGNINILLQTI